MRKALCSIFTLLIFAGTLIFTLNSFAQAHRPLVRLIYFIPSDRDSNPVSIAKIRTTITDVQKFYADEMERHGLQRKTFQLETDAIGKVVVHRAKGKFATTPYLHGRDAFDEVHERFDRKHIYFVIIEDGGERPTGGYSGECGFGLPEPQNPSWGGRLTVYFSCLDVSTTAHELGHAFGLPHDWRSDDYIMSYGPNPSEFSKCAVEWLEVHRAFNPAKPAVNTPSTVEMEPPSFVSPPNAIRLRFVVTDPDGIHQVQLHGSTNLQSGSPGLIAWAGLKGKPSSTIEFIVNASRKTNNVELAIIDVRGNFQPVLHSKSFSYPIDITSLLPRSAVVSIPDANLASAIQKTLGLTPEDPITQLDMLELISLNAYGKHITDLTGLEYATELKSLFLTGDHIRDFSPLAGLTKLKTLSLEYNRIVGTGPLLALLKKNPDLKLNIDIPTNEHPPMYWLTSGSTPKLQYLRSVSATIETLWESSIPLDSKVTALTMDRTGGVLFMTENVGEYFSDIWWVNLTGDPKVQNLTSVAGVIRGITIDPKRRELYWILSHNRRGFIQRLNLNEGGQTPKTLIQHLDTPGDITVDTEEGKLYWVEGTRIRQSDLNGANIQDVVTTDNIYQGSGIAITIADGKIYWTQTEEDSTKPLPPPFNWVGRILRADLNGSNIEEVERVEGFTVLRDLAVDVANKTLYYSQSSGAVTHVMRVDLNNLDAEAEIAVYSPSLGGPENIALGASLDSVGAAPVVHIESPNRPPMYWVDAEARTLHRLIADKVENLLPSVQNATNLAVDTPRGKLYWMEKISDRTSRIRGANLDGTNVKLVKDLTSVTHGIALDTVNGKLYLTNAWGKVQRLNIDGSNFQSNLITDLKSPKHITLDVADGQIYWTEQTDDTTGKIRRANLDGSNVQLVKDLTSLPRGLTLDTANKKLYLTNAYGKVQRLNVDGSNFQPNLITGLDTPMGVSVDVSGRKIYWTEQGSIRRADLNGENIEDVVTSLGTPIGIVLGTVPADAPAAPTIVGIPPTTTVLLSNYPNPFNPETWIPYQLAKSSDVQITIYDGRGVIVRQLVLGHQAPGFYTSRSRAAYWDGRNALGERVASGIYFYQLQAAGVSSLRKMLILK